MLPRPMGLELAMGDAEKSAFARADIGPAAVKKQRTCTVLIKRLFPLIEYGQIDLQSKLVHQFSRQEEHVKATAQRKNNGEQNNRHIATSSCGSANFTSAAGNIIAGSLNDGRDTTIG